MSLLFYWIYLPGFEECLCSGKLVVLVNVLTELKVCPPLDKLESVHVKSRISQAQSSVQRAKQETVNQPNA
jgi:hypothetical protein